jgi:hypothetical protein
MTARAMPCGLGFAPVQLAREQATLEIARRRASWEAGSGEPGGRAGEIEMMLFS